MEKFAFLLKTLTLKKLLNMSFKQLIAVQENTTKAYFTGLGVIPFKHVVKDFSHVFTSKALHLHFLMYKEHNFRYTDHQQHSLTDNTKATKQQKYLIIVHFTLSNLAIVKFIPSTCLFTWWPLTRNETQNYVRKDCNKSICKNVQTISLLHTISLVTIDIPKY